MRKVFSILLALVLVTGMLALGCQAPLPEDNGNGDDNGNDLIPGWTSEGTASGALNDAEVSVTWEETYEPAEPLAPMDFACTWKGAPAGAFPVSDNMSASELVTLLGIITITSNTGCSGLDEGLQSIHELVVSSYQIERVIKVFIEPGDHFVEIAISGDCVGIWPNDDCVLTVTGEWSEQPAAAPASLPFQYLMELTQEQAGTLQGKTRLALDLEDEQKLMVEIDTLYTFDPAGRPLLAQPTLSVIRVDNLQTAYDAAGDAWMVSLAGQGWLRTPMI